MNVSEFTSAVRDMRAAQNKYFKNRTQANLIAAKSLERAVDKALIDGIVFDLNIVSHVEPTEEDHKQLELKLLEGDRREEAEGR
jgi:hypothetical protein